MGHRFDTNLIHAKKGWPVVVATGIGGDTWSVYLAKPSGALQRCKQFGIHDLPEEALAELRGYKGKTLKRKEDK